MDVHSQMMMTIGVETVALDVEEDPIKEATPIIIDTPSCY